MIFGRGGGDGVINRVSKEAGFAPLYEVTALAGSFSNQRAAADLDQPLSDRVALRLNGVYENSDSFRKVRQSGTVRHQSDADVQRDAADAPHRWLRIVSRPSRRRPRDP